MRRTFGTLLTLGLLSSFLLAVVLGLMLVTGTVSVGVAVAVVVVFNAVMLLVGPRLNDFLYQWLYGLEWWTPEQLRERSPASADVVERVTTEYGYDHPRFGYIPDRNPTAFTYGSGRFNARVVLSEGCFEYLDDEELASVVGHELGHVTSRDFVVMTLANTVVEILYLVAVHSLRVAARSGTVGRQAKGSRAGNLVMGLYVVAALSYVLYVVGEYAVLYLSRVREYAADRFGAELTDPDALANALVAISYGLVDSEGDPELAKATRNLNIVNLAHAKETGVVYMNLLGEGEADRDLLLQSFRFDLSNPWARLLEFSSTHPRTGKRVERLSALPGATAFDFDEIRERFPVDRSRLYREFGRDVAYLALPTLLAVAYPLAYLTAVVVAGLAFSLLALVGGWLVAVGVATLAKTLYKYPTDGAEASTVVELLSDVYASPVRGRRVELDGELVGRGTAGYRLSPDLMFRDDTGLLFLKYDSWLPVLGDYLFAVRRVPELIGEEVTVSGWFLRGRTPWLGLRTLDVGGETVESYVNFGSLVAGGALVVLGVVVLAVQFAL